MDTNLLERAGAALCGPRWQTELALALGVGDRTMRRWVAGTSPLPAGLRGDLERLCRARRAALDDLLRAFGPGPDATTAASRATPAAARPASDPARRLGSARCSP